MKRILFLRDKGLCYDSLNCFRQLLGEALSEAGCSVSYASPDELENYIGLCDMVIGFNQIIILYPYENATSVPALARLYHEILQQQGYAVSSFCTSDVFQSMTGTVWKRHLAEH